MSRNEIEHLWTVNEVAEFLRLSPRSVRGRVARGAIPHLKVDGLLRFDPATIRCWVEEGTRGGKKLERATA